MIIKKKKGLTRHHLCYGEKEIIVEIPSKLSHLVLTGFQRMNPTRENLRLLRNFRRAVDYIVADKYKKIKESKTQITQG